MFQSDMLFSCFVMPLCCFQWQYGGTIVHDIRHLVPIHKQSEERRKRTSSSVLSFSQASMQESLLISIHKWHNVVLCSFCFDWPVVMQIDSTYCSLLVMFKLSQCRRLGCGFMYSGEWTITGHMPHVDDAFWEALWVLVDSCFPGRVIVCRGLKFHQNTSHIYLNCWSP